MAIEDVAIEVVAIEVVDEDVMVPSVSQFVGIVANQDMCGMIVKSIVVQKTTISGDSVSLYTGRVLVSRRCVVVAICFAHVVGTDGAYTHYVFGGQWCIAQLC